MYEALNQNLSSIEIQAYLERIGLEMTADTFSASKELLDQLIFAHQCAIPFENLDIYNKPHELELSTAALFNKIVKQRRGGYCFELNKLFSHLLSALGYGVYPHLAHVMMGSDEMTPPLHRVIMVYSDDQFYLADVGFGGPMPSSALPLLSGVHTDSAGAEFHLDVQDGVCLMSRVTADGSLERMLAIPTMLQLEVNFIAPNFYCSVAPTSHFVRNRIVNLRTPAGSLQLFDDQFKQIANHQVVEERTIANECELTVLLEVAFGIMIEESAD